MLEALLGDITALGGMKILTTRDARLPSLSEEAEVIPIGQGEDVWPVWERCILEADMFWPIAPENNGVLARLSELAEKHGKILLGSSPHAIALAASKYQTMTALRAAGMHVVPTFRPADSLMIDTGPWVAKPDDGAGCEDTRCFSDRAQMQSWLSQNGRMQTHVVQPYMPGMAASLSMLCKNGLAWLLSCNRQLVELHDGDFSYRGSVLNDMLPHWDEFESIARATAKAMPGLAGYVGIDVLVDEKQIHVLEVNPRLTTSYAGLRRAIGCNPARLVVDLLYNGDFRSLPDIARNIVEIRLNE